MMAVCRSIIRRCLMHKILAKQRASVLSHYYSNTYFGISDANSSVGSMSINDGTVTNRQKTPNLGSFFPTNCNWCSYATTGRFCNTHKICNISFHFLNANPQTFVVHTGFHFC